MHTHVDPVPYPRLMNFVRLDEAVHQFAADRQAFLRDLATLSNKERRDVARAVESEMRRRRKEGVR